ncbi:hypothetical protein AQUCO_08300039v1 [Aquilegia coerulea]|uniref:NB-ARC domain-containing protein n=1 Tax=Aquilegia coerulea TaxID=218851 RepID=A0A2G5C705_AQUCA|nr:hypothetical protein AQUCO_08300039v1 [Aquilegia coerulea]
MADALVSIVLEQLASVVKQKVKLVLSVRKDVKDLSLKLGMVKAVLHDAEMKQIKEEAVKLWLEQLKDLLYNADDVLDEWNTRTNLSSSSQIQGADNDDDYGIGTRIKEIRESFDEVNKNKESLMLNNQGPSHEEPHQRLTSSVVDVTEICGRDHDKDVIISKLLSESSHQDLNMNTHVISIVGTGGFGKTTLAKLVLEEPEVKETFDKRMWVCVSEPFNLIEVAKAIIQQAKGDVPTVNGWEALHQHLCDSVKGSRFLLVLDDVWTEDTNDWTPLKLSLNGGARGSRVIVTTRNEKVAQMMNSSYTHNLGKLSDDDSLSLFERIAFSGRQEDLAKLGNIGKEISKKCKGVPLAIKIVASLMRYKKAKKDWNHVLRSEIWDIPQMQKDFLPSLFLSYYPLPSILKQCFMYCAIFPKDTELEKVKLVKLWMAQGFLGSGGDKELEKIGEDYFDDLAMRSFFQNFRRDYEGNITSCMMHDLVHDFAQFFAKKECCILEQGKKLADDSKVRHISNNLPEGVDVDCSTIYKAKNLRTLFSRGSINLIMVFNELRSLRVLDLSWAPLEQLPDEVEQLLHLRYLNLSGTSLLELPKTISRLNNLQTLNLNWCGNLIKLPDGIGELRNLRHLELEETDELSCLPRGIGWLKFLRTLSKFIVGDASNGCDISKLKDLCFLRGRLVINGLGRVADAKTAAEAELKKKRFDVLSLNFDNSEEGGFDYMSGVLENLQPHEDVQELKILGFAGLQFPSWFQNSSMLINLAKLRLENCEKTTELSALGNLESLEELEVKALKSVKHIGLQFYGFGIVAFPKLKKLEISEMSELIEWEFPVSMAIMPCLQELELSRCPMLRALPSLGRLESLQSLKIEEMSSVKHIGLQFYGSGVVAFPKLKKLEISEMSELIEWEFPVSMAIMPCLQELELSRCPMLRALPSLGRLESLQSLKIEEMSSVKHIGLQFYGSGVVAFPKLKKLEISEMSELIEWEFPVSMAIMPCLQELELSRCPMLRALPGLGRLESLKSLKIHELNSIKRLGPEFWGVSADEFGGCSIQERVNGDGGGGSVGELIQEEEKGTSCFGKPVTSFPRLTKLVIGIFMSGWEEWILPPFGQVIIMPCLHELRLADGPKKFELPDLLARLKTLEILSLSYFEECEEGEDMSLPCLRELLLYDCKFPVIPRFLFPHTLKQLCIWECKNLRGMQSCLPPLLESLELNGDVGVLAESLPIEFSHNYLNLRSFKIYWSKHPSLPKGFNHLTAIQYLTFYDCESLDFDLNELKHLTMLQELSISYCSILAKRFQSPSGEDWMIILSHVPNIKIDRQYIKRS